MIENLDEDIFQDNIERWANFYPQEAILLPYIENEEYKVEKGHLIGPKGIYKTEEASSWFKKIGLKDEKSLVVYGVGLGEMASPILEWLKGDKERRVFFFEEDSNVLVKFFETAEAASLLQNDQVEIHLLHELDEKDPAMDKFFWSAVMTQVAVGIHPAYKEWYPKRALDFEHKIRYTLEIKNALVEEYTKYGVSFYRNFYFNILELPKAFLGNKLFGKFKGTPAVICGAGPSLDKQLAKLKHLKDKAFVVAGGSSLNALSHAGIMPHFSAALDPNAEQAIRIKTNGAENMPFFYRNRVFQEALELIKGPRLYITGSGGYDISDYFENELGIENEFIDEGHNVINFLCEIATRLGCSPIIFVGLDLAYTNNKTYAEGVVADTEVGEKEKPNIITHKTLSGAPILTEWKWLGEAKWIEEFAKEHPDQEFINCTEGGLGVVGIKDMPFQEAIDKYLQKNHSIAPNLASAIKKAKGKEITLARVKELMIKLQESLERCYKSLELMEQDAQSRIDNDPLALPKGNIPLIELDLLEEVGYRYVLDVFNHVLGCMQNASLRRLRMAQGNRPQVDIEKEKLQIQNERVVFLKDVAKINIQIIALALKEREKQENSAPYS